MISNSRQTSRSGCLPILLVALVIYLMAAEIVFQFRHPWMTSTERFLHTPDALQFKQLRYEDVRPRE